jgi:hypothetical protein
MNIPIKIKRGRGRPKKSVINPPEQNIVETPEEPIIKKVRKVNPEPVAKQTRKLNRWVEHCAEVKNRKENVGKSYREILKIAKLDYHK